MESPTLALLQRYESRNVTYVAPGGGWPIVWQKARGVWVWDETGRRYLDTTAAFGVAATGHANPKVVAAGRRQMGVLLHAMGDVHPHSLKARLAEELAQLTYGRWSGSPNNPAKPAPAKVLFGSSGFEAVEMALKTALLATGKPGVIAFEGGYHGLGYGALAGTHREHFRHPFRAQLREFSHRVPFPSAGPCPCPQGTCSALDRLERDLNTIVESHSIGAVLVEPIQARGGIIIPCASFLPRLRDWCSRRGVLLILDEIYTGFGRTGAWFASERAGIVPDLICLGKALTGGFPLSACVGRVDIMDAWPPSNGEAIHTSTFLGHPVGCAMALAQIEQLQSLHLVERCRAMEDRVSTYWQKFPRQIGPVHLFPRHQGAMIGIELRDSASRPFPAASLWAIQRLLSRGYIFLPEGAAGEVIALTPPLTISWRKLRRALDEVVSALGEWAAEFGN